MVVKKTTGLTFSLVSRVLLLFTVFLLVISWTVLKITENAVLKEQIINYHSIVRITSESIRNLKQSNKELDIEELLDWILKPVRNTNLLLSVIIFDKWETVYSIGEKPYIKEEIKRFITSNKKDKYFINYTQKYLSLSNYRWIDFFSSVDNRYTIFMRFDISRFPITLYKVYKLIFFYMIVTTIIIFTVLIFFIHKRIIKPIGLLNNFADKVGTGHFPKNNPYKRNDEIGELAKSMLKMSNNIEKDRDIITKQIEDLNEAYNKLKQMQDEIIKSEKFALVGQMTSGLAHEIGNPITSILGFSQLLLSSKELSNKDRDLIERILNEGRRIDKLIKELLSFSRPKKEEIAPVNIKDLIERAIDLLQHQGKFKMIEIESNLMDMVLCTEGNKLYQVLINLLINAADAIEEKWNNKKGGIIKVMNSEIGNSVMIGIEDNGIGINKENLKKIFLPFFTSKDPGKGNGLGLYVSSNIIDQLQGKIEVESSPGKGTIFKIYLQKNNNLC